MFGIKKKEKANPWIVLLLASIATALISFHEIIPLVGLPTLRLRYNMESDMALWFIASYIITFASSLIINGFLADKFGRRKVLMIGLVGYAIANILVYSWVSESNQFILTQILTGLSAAAIISSSLAILIESYPKKELLKAISIWSGILVSSIVLSILVGGAIINNIGIDFFFMINVIVCGLILIGVFFGLPESKYTKENKFDLIEVALLTATIGIATYGIIFFPKYGIFDAKIIAAVIAASILKTMLFLYYRKNHDTIFPFRFILSQPTLNSIYSIALLFLTIGGVIFLSSEILQLTKELDAITSGIIVLPMAIAFLIAPSIGRNLTDQFQNKKLVTYCLYLVGISIAIMSLWTYKTDVIVISISLFFFGFVAGIPLGIVHSEVLGKAKKEKLATIAGTITMYRIIPSALSLSIIQWQINNRFSYIMNNNIQGQIPPDIANSLTSSIAGAYTVASQLATSGLMGQALALKAIAGQAYFSAVGTGLVLIAIITIIFTMYIDSSIDIKKRLLPRP